MAGDARVPGEQSPRARARRRRAGRRGRGRRRAPRSRRPLTKRWGRTLSDEFKRAECHAGRYETSLVLAAGGRVRAVLARASRGSGVNLTAQEIAGRPEPLPRHRHGPHVHGRSGRSDARGRRGDLYGQARRHDRRRGDRGDRQSVTRARSLRAFAAPCRYSPHPLAPAPQTTVLADARAGRGERESSVGSERHRVGYVA